MDSPSTRATKDSAHVSPTWNLLEEGIDGVQLHEVKNFITRHACLTEIFRTDWGLLDKPVAHITHVAFRPGQVSAWHMHRLQTDHLFVVAGTFKFVLYDDREGSPSRGRVQEARASILRPTLLIVPPGIWHGAENLEQETSCFINFFDREYNYADPDEWRLPIDAEEIPYSF